MITSRLIDVKIFTKPSITSFKVTSILQKYHGVVKCTIFFGYLLLSVKMRVKLYESSEKSGCEEWEINLKKSFGK